MSVLIFKRGQFLLNYPNMDLHFENFNFKFSCVMMILIFNLSSLIYHFCLHTTILSSPFWLGPNFIELLKQKIFLNIFLVSRNEQDTSHKLYLWHGILAGNLFLISVILYTFCAGAALWTRAHWVINTLHVRCLFKMYALT